MNNTSNTIVLQPFRDLLKSNDIPDNQVPFWELWVKQYLRYCESEYLQVEDSKHVDLFLAHLKENNRKPWQIEQARRACSIYLQLLERSDLPEQQDAAPVFIASTDNTFALKSEEMNKLELSYPERWEDLVKQTENTLVLQHYAKNTLRHYTHWVKRFGKYCNFKDTATIHVSDVRMFLEYLAVNLNVSSSHQNQAFNALLYLFRHVLHLPFEGLQSTIRAKEVKYLPEVLSQDELKTLFKLLDEPYRLLAELYYGCGLRLEEGLSIRIKDLDFSKKIIIIKGKGKKDRYLPIPETLIDRLNAQVKKVKYLHTKEVKSSEFGGVFLPDSVTNKSAQFAKELGWYWLFPAPKLTFVKEENAYRRYHIHDTVFERIFQGAVRASGIPRRIKVHTLRHTFGTDLLAAGYDIRQVQDLLGHTDVRTTMIYTHIVRPDQKPIRSPLDLMREREVGEDEDKKKVEDG